MTKKEARKAALARRDAIPEKERRELSRIIEGYVLQMPEYKEAENVFLYASCKSEVDTAQLVEETIRKKGRVFLPKVMDKTRMSFFEVTYTGELKKSSFGIPEPEGSKNEEKKADLFIIPLTAFSEDLDRAGYGGGYYDRYLKNYAGRVKIAALAFYEQLIPKFETDEYDLKPDFIITQKGIIKERKF